MADSPGDVKEGGAPAYDGAGTIYALRGDDEKNFWKYTISANRWSSLTDAPDDVKDGGALVYLNGAIYALRGDDKKDFWRFASSP